MALGPLKAALLLLGLRPAGSVQARRGEPADHPTSILDGKRPRLSCLHFGLEWDNVTCEHLGWPRAARKRRVIDAFAYNGEADIFEARHRELRALVDGTAVLTTALNFKGLARPPPEPPVGANVRHRLLPAEAFDSCRSLNGSQSEYRECACSVTKNDVAEVVEEFDLDPEDWVIFGDADEIPNREVVRLLQECEVPVGEGYKKQAVHLDARYHYYYDLRCKNKHSKWGWKNHKTPAALKVAQMREYGLRVLQAARAPACVRAGKYASCTQHLRNDERALYLPCTSWHLSSFGGADRTKRKLLDNVDWSGRLNDAMLRDCRKNHSFRMLSRPNVEYPAVPHSVAEDPERFALFMRNDMAGNKQHEGNLTSESPAITPIA